MRPCRLATTGKEPDEDVRQKTQGGGESKKAKSRKKKNNQCSRSSLSASNDCRLVDIPPLVSSAGYTKEDDEKKN